MSLGVSLTTWDGKSADAIAAIGAAHEREPGYAAELVRLATLETTQGGATWLLLALLKSGACLTEEQTGELLGSLSALQRWDARLHVLQSLPFLTIDESQRFRVEAFVRHSLNSSNKFVRAWSYNGLYELARRFPSYRDELEQTFTMALRDEAASVKARIRNLQKAGFPET